MRTGKKIRKLIKFRPELFWDVDPETIDPGRHARYIIERILDFGNDKEVRWMWEYYPKRLLRDTLKKSRAIFPFTKSLWQELVKSR